MIVSAAWAGKRYAVLGLARSGTATVHALLAGGAQVTAWDSDPEKRDAITPSLRLRGEGRGEGQSELPTSATAPLPTLSPQAERGLLEVVDLDTVDLASFEALVVSPGVPLNTHPLAAKARAAGVPIIGDIELFAQARADLPPHKVVGITGTNGKSTTTALVTHILKTAGVPALMGGNIGLPILGAEPLPAGGVYVLELSSYQIDLTHSLDCDVAVLLNITPDHLDRYDGFEAYASSKERLFEMQSETSTLVFGSSAHAQRRATYDRYFNDGRNVYCQLYYTVQDPADLWDPFDSRNWRSVQSDWPALQGPHNAENAGAAFCVCKALGMSNDELDGGLRTFTGLPHRMEKIGEIAGVAYVNDSKATNPDSTAPALAAFDRVHWIVGGRAKGGDLDACAPYFSHVACAYTIGEAGPLFARVLDGKVPVEEAGTLASAVVSAARHARSGDTVLLSPAAASFDQFRDYEHRGQVFREAVGGLA
ncbi:UDP-N-acetylmuramoyl-L-alanine--D-glutamate ligase [Sphingomonas radiodurans]|uniref:UDP-N-acetylmuramoyl-L-alanine--D-glutamate ligase n=1 Tax=Sphingomonas radiodurans TaxID=2890321 RepID=UPI001E64894B|nr:UDP-N-acetylmuramoyl-L-alanine--D-glutamate ligase [Sphingomonas radiodurans]WBH15926.1 UDP-N-acetylmuramoyl-L-alanine--D-glutamate ligase [Sphingomonas radiodurans]